MGDFRQCRPGCARYGRSINERLRRGGWRGSGRHNHTVGGGGSAPAGVWLECNGQNASRSLYAALFEAVGTAWGVGDGATTFTLPDLRGRGLIGKGQGSGLTNRSLAAIGGAETHVLSMPEMPAHSHGGGIVITYDGYGVVGNSNGNRDFNVTTTGSQGGSAAHNNMHPFAVTAFFVKAG